MSNIYLQPKKERYPQNQGANQQRDCDANRKISVWINTLFCRIGHRAKASSFEAQFSDSSKTSIRRSMDVRMDPKDAGKPIHMWRFQLEVTFTAFEFGGVTFSLTIPNLVGHVTLNHPGMWRLTKKCQL